MRILWLDDDRSMRVCDFWTPLRLALSEIADVECILRQLDREEGRYCRAVTIEGLIPKPLIDPSYANTFDWIILAAPWSFMHEDWEHITSKRAIMWADNHGPMVKTYVGWAYQQEFDLFLPKYRDGAKRFHDYLPQERVVWLPYWVDESYLMDYNQPKTIGLLLTGALHPKVYPFRTRVGEACGQQPWFQRVQRPKENLDGKYWPVGKDYACLLNQAHIAVSGTSRYGYSLTKLFEISACRTALLTDWIPEMKALGFEPEVNCLLPGPKSNILDYVKYWLGVESKLQEITDAGFRLMHTRHTTTIRAQQLKDTLAAR